MNTFAKHKDDEKKLGIGTSFQRLARLFFKLNRIFLVVSFLNVFGNVPENNHTVI
jgi:hypothetical protein